MAEIYLQKDCNWGEGNVAFEGSNFYGINLQKINSWGTLKILFGTVALNKGGEK